MSKRRRVYEGDLTLLASSYKLYEMAKARQTKTGRAGSTKGDVRAKKARIGASAPTRAPMRKVAAALVRDNFSGTIDAVRMTRERIVIERHGTSVAAIVPVEDAELLAALEADDDVRVAQRRLRAIRAGKTTTIAAADVYKKLGL